MPTTTENVKYWSSYDWSGKGEEWTAGYSPTGYGKPSVERAWYAAVYPRLRDFLPTGTILELAPGYGLWTRLLRPLCERMILVDLTPNCIDHCRKVFGEKDMQYVVNDGKSLEAVPNDAVDFVFSWHSLVHCERDVMQAYAAQLAHKMRPGAFGLIHHSNFAEFVDPATKQPRIENTQWRGVTMSAAAFREDCRTAGLAAVYQEIVPWGYEHLVDCFTLFKKPTPGDAPVECVVQKNPFFWEHTRDAARIFESYIRS
ncbi:MAG: class I SAM-dependent methyltransferase [Phycisphaerales bacterium]|jgi:hypothetical protein|nr:class I SAM-dependent methyltransferase [Phycisphaerales bacterium]